MERRFSLLFGIIGGVFLTQINGLFQLQMAFGSMNGYVTDFIFRILSIIGLICIIYFSIIWDGVYYHALSNYPNISDWELKGIIKFVEYEKNYARIVEIVSDNQEIMKKMYLLIVGGKI